MTIQTPNKQEEQGNIVMPISEEEEEEEEETFADEVIDLEEPEIDYAGGGVKIEAKPIESKPVKVETPKDDKVKKKPVKTTVKEPVKEPVKEIEVKDKEIPQAIMDKEELTFTILVSEIKNIIDIVSPIIQEIPIYFTGSGWKFIAMDLANVAMVIGEIPKQTFMDYPEIKIPKKAMIDVSDFKRILRRKKSDDDILKITVNQWRFIINIIGEINKTFKLPIIEDQKKPTQIPSMEHKGMIISADVGLLEEAIEDCGIISESILFSILDNDKLQLIGKGDTQDAKSILSDIEGASLMIEKGKSDNPISKYSKEYLIKLIQGKKIANRVKLEFLTDYPLVMTFKSDKVLLKFILAPRVDS